MRRIVLLLVLAGTMSGCAVSDRFAYARQDPFLWFLSGMPAPYDLSYPRAPLPDLPVLNPVDYVPQPAPQPLDYPRGWNPDNPPLMPAESEAAPAATHPDSVAEPDSRCVVTDCTNLAPPLAGSLPADAAAGVRAAVARAGAGDSGRD